MTTPEEQARMRAHRAAQIKETEDLKYQAFLIWDKHYRPTGSWDSPLAKARYDAAYEKSQAPR